MRFVAGFGVGVIVGFYSVLVYIKTDKFHDDD